MKKLILFAVVLVLGGCLDNEPLTNDSDQAISFFTLQQEIYEATSNTNPEQITINPNTTGDFVYFSEKARFATAAFQAIGLKTHQGLEKNENTITYTEDDGTVIVVPVFDFKFLSSSYKIEADGTPVLDVQKELVCSYAKTPYSLWLDSCDLPPFQDYYVYYLRSKQELPYFFNFKKRSLTMPLPALMAQEGRCFNLPNCTANITELEFDLIITKEGERQRQHIVLWLTKDLPYLASNPKYCINTLVEVDNQRYPYEYCKELVNFIPGN